MAAFPVPTAAVHSGENASETEIRVAEADSAGTINADISVIYYEDKPVGLKFDGRGAPEEVLSKEEVVTAGTRNRIML